MKKEELPCTLDGLLKKIPLKAKDDNIIMTTKPKMDKIII